MSLPDDQVAELKQLFPNAQAAKEGGITYVLLPNATMPAGCTPQQADLLLCPAERDGYASRLYFSTQVRSSTQLNWNGNTRVLERNWTAYSWKVPAGLRLLQMLQAHLRALR